MIKKYSQLKAFAGVQVGARVYTSIDCKKDSVKIFKDPVDGAFIVCAKDYKEGFEVPHGAISSARFTDETWAELVDKLRATEDVKPTKASKKESVA